MKRFIQTMFGGFVFPFLAATHCWFPKVTGCKDSEHLGKAHFRLMFLGFLAPPTALYQVGLMGMLRRVADYIAPDYIPWNIAATVSGVVIGLSILVLIFNLVRSLRLKQPASANHWRGRPLEWQVSSPPPEENFVTAPIVVAGPYEHGEPGSVYARCEPRAGYEPIAP